MDVKINFSVITKNHAADPEKGFLAKSISKSNGYATAMPTAWELTLIFVYLTFGAYFDFFEIIFGRISTSYYFKFVVVKLASEYFYNGEVS